MISAPQPAVVHLFTIFRQIGAGELRIPAFQREFVWKDSQVVDLLTSVREQYPIGSILLWHVDKKIFEIASNRVTAFPDVPESFPTNYVLDGSQRLSALYGSFHFKQGNNPSFDVHYDLRHRRFFNESDRDRAIIDDEATIPIASLMSPRRMLEHQARLAGLSDGDTLLEELLVTQASFQDYMVPVVRIQGLDLDRVVAIFERVNSTGTRLDMVDFMRAITWNQSFDLNFSLDMVRELLPGIGSELSDETIIKCVGLVLGVLPSEQGLLSLREKSAHDLNQAFQGLPSKLELVFQFLKKHFHIENMAYVPYEGQLLVLFKAIGLQEASTPSELRQIERWFWATGFNESLRGKPDHYVVRAVENWRALVQGHIRGLEPHLRLTTDDLLSRRLIRGRALSSTFATMFAVNGSKSLVNAESIPAALYMSASDLGSFQIIFDADSLRKVGINGPSPRIFPNIILTNPADDSKNNVQNWRTQILALGEAGQMEALASQFIDRAAFNALARCAPGDFLARRATLFMEKARELVNT
jgi:hypothetical protein